MRGLTPRGENVLVAVAIVVFLIVMGIVGGMDVVSDLPNDG